MRERTRKSDREWQEVLTPEQFAVTRRKGTEPAYTGKYCDFQGVGVYRCVCCGNALFSSEAKLEEADGTISKWPAFRAPVARENVRTERDLSLFLIRTEVLCAGCDAHLGYVFNDGRVPAGMRYLVNSSALAFVGCRGRHAHASAFPSPPAPTGHSAFPVMAGPA